MRNKIFHFALALGAVAEFCLNAGAMTWKHVPMDQRLNDADIVVIGNIVEVSTRALSIGHLKIKPSYTAFYDLGAIAVTQTLKGEPQKFVHVFFDSKDQVDNPWRGHHKFFGIGDGGIWLLKRDWRTGNYYLPGPPPNPLPLSSENEVVSILNKSK